MKTLPRLALAALAPLAALAAPAFTQTSAFDLRILAINDFHDYLRPAASASSIPPIGARGSSFRPAAPSTWQPASMKLDTINDYLSLGGDGFTVFKGGTAAQFGVYDNDALFAWFSSYSPIAPAPPTRITRVN